MDGWMNGRMDELGNSYSLFICGFPRPSLTVPAHLAHAQ